MYDIGQFSKKKQSLYFSSLFMSENIKELKYRMQFSDTYNLINQHYISFISGLMENKINYDIKFYNDDHFYNVYSTESVNDSTFFANVLIVNSLGFPIFTGPGNSSLLSISLISPSIRLST